MGVAVLVSAVLVGTTAAKGSSINVSVSSTPHLTAGLGFAKIVYPMEITVTSISLVQSNGHFSAKVLLAATNNLGLEPTYTNASVSLQNLTLQMSYTGLEGNETDIILASPTAVLGPNGTSNLAINTAPLQLSSLKGTSVAFTVTGSFSYVLTATLGDSPSATIQANGKGIVQQFETNVVT
jgi:hypothetical protein